jgi:hypothetical protein
MKIFIKGNVPSSKNSKQFVTFKTGKKMLINSKTVRNYIKNHSDEWWQQGIKFREMIKGKEKPYRIGFYFIRDSKRKFDYINAAQLPLDLMQEFGWIEDDNMTNVIPVFLGYEVDKENTGVRIEIL